ncbi:probable prefoldin subunit 4 [Ctenocephalides felis]|uniref:probable prefoldin subunit 4 n=1 Tax=Ctenocephalides felis TaxID=7515 RepID=UPI000E6E2B8B|nr:probable prefoldin subunit 4 [Ctenocephalides felis]XP_026480941.1 probable prefoldin subunit 4 [Ctenocephalides felis]
MSGASGKGTFQPDSDVHISYEDQQKINKFARHNARLEDFKDELNIKINELKNLDEACEELILMSDDANVPFLVGEVFICRNLEETQKQLEEAKAKKEKEIADLTKKCDHFKSEMNELKGHLYSRFGSHINLENEE